MKHKTKKTVSEILNILASAAGLAGYAAVFLFKESFQVFYRAGSREQRLLLSKLYTDRNKEEEKNENAPVAEETEKHTLPVTVYKELYRLKQINDSRTGGSVKRLENELLSRGYTIRDLAGEIYDEGMNVRVACFTPGSEEESGKIIRMIRPCVLYKGIIVEQGTVEVAVSEK